jgi:hypothetical protein
MRDQSTYSVSIEARGEGVRYIENGRQYLFDRSHGNVLYAYAYSDGTPPFTDRRLTEEEKERIIPRIVAHLERDGEKAKVVWEPPPAPLKTS